ncbi:MAG: hypothetical protein CL609_08675 [Anaerolineaceae bacterium]|nr:hypothetical protein [Anaerolineaceae bacterium]
MNEFKIEKRSLISKAYGYTGRTRRKTEHFLTKWTDENLKQELEISHPAASDALVSLTKNFRAVYRKYLNNLEYSVEMMSGNSGLGDDKFNVLYIGDDCSTSYFRQTFFPDSNPANNRCERVGASTINDIVNQYKLWADLIIFERNITDKWTPPSGNWLRTPRWVNMVYKIDREKFCDKEIWAQDYKKNNRSNYSKVKRAGFVPYYSNKVEDFKLFYNRMYIPMVKNRFQSCAETASLEYVLSRNTCGTILFSCNPSGEKLAGILILPCKGTIYGWINGILDGDENLCKMGILSSLYIFSMEYAYDHGFSIVNMGGVRPIENDGVYIHKKRWGFSPMIDPWLTTDWLFWVPNKSKTAMDWLRDHCFLSQFVTYKGKEFDSIYSTEK